MRAGITLLVAATVLIKLDLASGAKVCLCYYRSAARHRTTIAKFELKHIDFSLCTHYVYAYGRVDNLTMVLQADSPSVEEGSFGLFRRFTKGAQTQASPRKALLAIGGPEEHAHYGLAGTAMSDEVMKAFVKSVVSFVKTNNFDGLVLDWQAPDNFDTRLVTVGLIERLRAEFYNQDSINMLLVLVAQRVNTQLDMRRTIATVSRHVDYIAVKAYDFPNNDMTYALFSSPLFARLQQPPYNMYCVNFSVTYWNSVGIAYDKMLVGLSGVGRLLELASGSKSTPGSPITKKIEHGAYYNIKSGLAYPEVCGVRESALSFFDDIQKNPYLVRGNTWIGYEDRKSLEFKIKWFETLGVAGIMFAGLDEDDFTGTMCGEGKYPLLSKIRQLLRSDNLFNPSTTESSKDPRDKRIPGKDDLPFRITMANIVILIISVAFLFLVGLGIGHMINANRKVAVKEVVPEKEAKEPPEREAKEPPKKKAKQPPKRERLKSR